MKVFLEIPSNQIGDSSILNLIEATVRIGDSGAPGAISHEVSAIKILIENKYGDSINIQAVTIEGGNVRFASSNTGIEFSNGQIVSDVSVADAFHSLDAITSMEDDDEFVVYDTSEAAYNKVT